MFGKLPGRTVETDINRVVTPMLDVTFQLLFFFVINFRPAIAEGQVDLHLSPEQKIRQEAPALDAHEAPDEYRIAVYSFTGTIDLVTFQFKQFEPTELPQENPIGELKARLKQIPRPVGGSPPVIKVECDKRLKYSELMRVMNLCREEGFKNIGILPLNSKKGPDAKE